MKKITSNGYESLKRIVTEEQNHVLGPTPDRKVSFNNS